MAALNFPEATFNGQTFEADTGVIYVYQGNPPNGFWSATSTKDGQQNQDARYVQVAGDDMTGNLTFNTSQIELNATTGAATFAGNISAKYLETINTDQSHNVNINVDAGALISSPDSSGAATFLLDREGSCQWGGTRLSPLIKFTMPAGSATFAGDIDAGNVFFKLEPDNDANYTTTTDAEGNETSVYNGPTLDVKDRLTKTGAALTALKAAASNSNTTLEELKSAFVAALADF